MGKSRFASQSTWKDFALLKLCLCAIGIMIGIRVPKEHKKSVKTLARIVFLVTYIPLMGRVFEMVRE